MTQDIKYTGLSANPSDHESPDGDLANAINLIPEDGQLKPIFQPKDLAHLPSGYEVVFIHKTANFTHYIVKKLVTTGGVNATRLMWLDESVILGENVQHPVSESTIISSLTFLVDLYKIVRRPGSWNQFVRIPLTIANINAIGNTLVILTDNGMYYCLWKGSDESYQYLGNHLPELNLSFGLQGSTVVGEQFSVDHRKSVSGGLPNYNHPPTIGQMIEYSGTNSDMREFIRIITEQIMAQVNRTVSEQTDKGKFIMPFFVRYAYRLFDGTLTMHSSPILMVTTSGVAPHVVFDGFYNDGEGLFAHATLKTAVFDLDFKVIENDISYLNNWSDIIRSVDIFISAPIYCYDQSGNIKGLTRKAVPDWGFTLCRIPEFSVTADRPYYMKKNTLRMFGYYNDEGCSEYVLPSKYDFDFSSIRDCNNFYLLKSVDIDELPVSSRQKIDVPEGHLTNLVTRESMTDDYYSHDMFIPRYSFNYNSRLNIANINKVSAVPMNPASYLSFVDKYRTNNELVYYDKSYTIYVCIKSDGRDIVLRSDDTFLSSDYPFLYFFYPDPNAYKAFVVAEDNNGITIFTLPLKRHDYLNGAVFFDGWNPTIASSTDETIIPAITTENSVQWPNKIFTSEINNPFFFPVTSINSVGIGDIIGISAAAKALSQGQFGQFPLYAFTTDGVWALEVSATGTFSARQPITRDVCVNPDSITQIDSAVLFATNRGIMHIAGSQATCITDVIATEYPFNPLALPHLDDLHAMIHAEDTCLPTQPFLTFLKDCRMLYDYLHQRITLFNINYSYAYVFSLKSKQWGMTFSDLRGPLNSYPDALAMAYDATNGNKLVSFSDTDEAVSKGLLVSRPLKLGNGDTFKTIRTLIQRGMFSRGDVKLVLYGSRDLEHWYVVGSSTTHEIRNISGTPYKYFRIAAVSTFTPDKSLSDATIEVVPKQTNRLH